MVAEGKASTDSGQAAMESWGAPRRLAPRRPHLVDPQPLPSQKRKPVERPGQGPRPYPHTMAEHIGQPDLGTRHGLLLILRRKGSSRISNPNGGSTCIARAHAFFT